MANMFSGNREKQIPKTFKDCYKTDNLTDNLWLWCERLEIIGKVLAVITAIVVFIIFITLTINEYGYYIFIGLIITPITAFLEYITFHIIALLVGSLASIVQHTRISANIALYTNSDKGINSSTKTENTKSMNVTKSIDTTNKKQSTPKNNKENKTDDLIIYTGENTFDPCPSTAHKEYIEEIKSSTDIWRENCHWEKYFESNEKILICNHCNNIIAFYDQLSFKTCKYCGKKVPVGSERCECGCIAFEE